MKMYEGLFILDGALKDAEVDAAVERLGGEISRLRGSVQRKRILGKRTFARRLRQGRDGHYVEFVFELDPSNVAALRARLKLMQNLFRSQIVAVKQGPAEAAQEKPAEEGAGNGGSEQSVSDRKSD